MEADEIGYASLVRQNGRRGLRGLGGERALPVTVAEEDILKLTEILNVYAITTRYGQQEEETLSVQRLSIWI